MGKGIGGQYGGGLVEGGDGGEESGREAEGVPSSGWRG